MLDFPRWKIIAITATILLAALLSIPNILPKAQQDVLLPHIERGTVRFIGATTHNPFFYVNSPLVSRSQVFQLEPLGSTDIVTLLRAARPRPRPDPR